MGLSVRPNLGKRVHLGGEWRVSPDGSSCLHYRRVWGRKFWGGRRVRYLRTFCLNAWINQLRTPSRRSARVPQRKCFSSTLRNARIFLRPVLESLGWEQPIAAEFGVPKLHRKKIICVRKIVRVCGRVVITFLFVHITPCFYALNGLTTTWVVKFGDFFCDVTEI